MEAQQQAALAAEAETQAIAPVPPPLEQQPQDPGSQTWNPPAGGDDFDSLFQRLGVDGENITNSNTVPTELTTAPEEPAPQEPKVVTPEPSKFELKTKTGTVYKNEEEAIKGIETKDRTIEQLRSMLAAVTGEDPLAKSGAKPGQTTELPKPVSYLKDPTRFAQDLTQAAEYGQKTNDWTKYANVFDQRTYEVVQAAVGPYIPVVQKVGKQEAMETVSREIPDFRDFYGSAEYQKVLEARPRLASYIKTLEGNPTMQEDLVEQYHAAWNDHQVKRLAELASKPAPVPQNPTPRTPLQAKTTDFKQEPNDGMRRAKPVTKPTLADTQGRKALIEELERRGIADLSW